MLPLPVAWKATALLIELHPHVWESTPHSPIQNRGEQLSLRPSRYNATKKK